MLIRLNTNKDGFNLSWKIELLKEKKKHNEVERILKRRENVADMTIYGTVEQLEKLNKENLI